MEDAYIIKGGKALNGSIKLSGAKNVALKVIIASLLFDQAVTLHNVPRINDVDELLNLINILGGKASFVDHNSVIIDGTNIKNNEVDLIYGTKIRVSFMLFAPLLHKFKSCYVPNPGGCRIGARPIDRIIDGMKHLGIKVEYNSQTGYYKAEVNNQPANYYFFTKPSHTGTELLVLLSVLGKSLFKKSQDRIMIDNAALEPEIDELIRFLNEGGAKIKREGQKINIYPVEKITRKSPFTINSDRNEAVTYASLALATKGEIYLSKINNFLLDNFIKKVKEIGGGVEHFSNNSIRFYYKGILRNSLIETAPHPGFMTDWQPNWAVLMTQAKGESIIRERVFENRFSYVDELRKLGANIEYVKLPVTNPLEYFFFNFDPHKKYNQAIKIIGPQQLHGGVMTITDLRAGATLAIAALTAQGESVINGASILERGYEDFVGKIRGLGGEIEKV